MTTKHATERFVAHRGWPAQYPENSLSGIRAAIDAGACNIEFDIQLSRDRVPVVLHDANLARTGDDDRKVFELPVAELMTLNNGEPRRFNKRFAAERVPSLQSIVSLLTKTNVTVFAEIKRQSIRYFGADVCLDAILPLLQPLKARLVVLSFDAECARLAKQRGAKRIGWAFEHWTLENLETAQTLHADYLFCDSACIDPDKSLLLVDSRWVIYDVDTLPDAQKWFARGADLIETDFIGEFLDTFSGEFSAEFPNESALKSGSSGNDKP